MKDKVITVTINKFIKVELFAQKDKKFKLGDNETNYTTLKYNLIDYLTCDKSTVSLKNEFLEAGDISVDLKKHEVKRGGERVELNPKEFELMVFLLSNKGQVVSREQIQRKVQGYDYIGSDRQVDVHMGWMRSKLEVEPEHPCYLIKVRGYGYKIAS